MNLSSQQIIGGHYEIIKVLGKGGFGETYLAQDLHAMNKECVVKRLTFEIQDPEMLEKARSLFEREAKVLYDLTNNNSSNIQQIPRFLAYFEENQQFYLVQEYIEGSTLRNELKQKGKLNETEAVKLLEDVLEILKFLHNCNPPIIHRDIKPENLIRRSGDNKIILIDFGSVTAREKISKLQSSKTYIRTYGYSPKEQLEGNAQPNSDIYALGITALEILTGKSSQDFDPYREIDVEQVINFTKASVSKPLQKILQKMVEFDAKNRRYQSVNAVIYDLKIYQKNQQFTESTSPRTANVTNFSSTIAVTPQLTITKSEHSEVNNSFKKSRALPVRSVVMERKRTHPLMIGFRWISVALFTGLVLGFFLQSIFSGNEYSPDSTQPVNEQSNPETSPIPENNQQDSNPEPPIRFIPVEPEQTPESDN